MLVYFDCFSGASGDMLLGGLLDLGLALADLEAHLARIPLGGYRLEAARVTRHGLTGTHLRVLVDADDRPARSLHDVSAIIGAGTLSERVKARSLAVFRRLAEVEAGIHGVAIEDIHFHEIGAVDSLVDIVGFCAALEHLGIDSVRCSPLPLGGGTIRTEHGLLPIPAPATLALLAGAGAPTVPGPGGGELVTPTGAALLTHFAEFRPAPMTVRAVGYGFGTKEFDWPNVLRVWAGDSIEPESRAEDQVVLLACNLDDASGQVLGYAMERLLAAGALDVWFTPIQMKKNRPAVELSVLTRPAQAEAMAQLLLRETPTLGVRTVGMRRSVAGREMYTVETAWGPVRVKVKRLGGQPVSASPEYDDCARLAAGAGVPLAVIMDAARRAAGVPG